MSHPPDATRGTSSPLCAASQFSIAVRRQNCQTALMLAAKEIPATLTVTRVNPALGAVVEGVTLAGELPQSTIDALSRLLIEHQILFFRDQPITPQAQCGFAKRF